MRTLPAPCLVLSDTHLGVAPPEVERQLLGFLRAAPALGRSLVINGDLFDFWFEWKHVLPRAGFRVLAALADAREAGMEIVWVAGNHDCWGGEILREDVGVEYTHDALDGMLGGWRARIEHGDGLREVEDRPYRRVRTVMRHPLAIRVFRRLHPDLASRIALGSSHASRTHRARDEGAGLKRVAFDLLASRPELELVVFGHSHVATLERRPGARGIYGNPGSWVDAPLFLRLDGERAELRRWTGSAEGDRLHALDRLTQEALPLP